MDIGIYTKLTNVISAEADYVIKNEKDKEAKLDKLDTLINLAKILNNYDKLKPVIKEFLNKKAEKEKWER